VIAPPQLARSASGLRHLRWSREVLGSLLALAALGERGARFSEEQRDVARAEVTRVTGLVTALSTAVKPYRDFLERTRTRTRGDLRVAELLAGAASLPFELEEGAAEAALQTARTTLASVIEPQRRALHAELARAVDELREGLAAMHERVAAAFSPEIAAALFPPLTDDASRVRDGGDPDDDAAG
jgi:hypothetical protein